MSSKPLIFLACYPRSGSTILGELLSEPPKCWVFNETHIGIGGVGWSPTPGDRSYWSDKGKNLPHFHTRNYKSSYDTLMKAKKLIGVEQLGIKEIRSTGWEKVVQCEPNTKFIINSRDPRDIYISYYQLAKGKKLLKEQGIGHLCGIMKLEFKQQKAIMETQKYMVNTYEELTTNPEQIKKIRTFLENEVEEQGSVGEFLKGQQDRKQEHVKNGFELRKNEVTWKNFLDEPKVAEHVKIVERELAEMMEFFGYK